MLSASLIPLNHSRIEFAISVIYGTAFLISSVKSNMLLNHSSNLTKASPMLAVTSRISKLKAPSTCLAILNAVLKTPPTTVEITWIIENSPLNVRLSLSAVSPLTFSFCENSLRALITLYNCITVGGGNTSNHASLIAPIIATRPFPAFANDSKRRVRPSFFPISSTSSCIDLPVFLDWVSKSLYIFISSSVNPAFFSCSSERFSNFFAVSSAASDVLLRLTPNFFSEASISSTVSLY